MAFPIIAVLGAVGTVLKPVVGIAKGWFEKRRAKQDSELRVNEAKTEAMIERIRTSQQGDIAWENTSLNHSGWKDEYWTLVLSIPAVMCFVPGAVQYVKDGFEALAQCPKWYQWMLAVCVASAFGYRKLADLMALKKGD